MEQKFARELHEAEQNAVARERKESRGKEEKRLSSYPSPVRSIVEKIDKCIRCMRIHLELDDGQYDECLERYAELRHAERAIPVEDWEALLSRLEDIEAAESAYECSPGYRSPQ